eukprot:gene46218-57636_t
MESQVVSGNSTVVPKALVSVTQLDLKSLLGRWYMMYSSQVPLNTTLKDAACVTQDLGLNFVAITTSESSSSSSPKISSSEVDFDVELSFTKINSSTLQMNTLQGIAFNDRFLKAPGQFMLDIHGEETDLWVLALGPITSPHKTIASLNMLSTGGKHNGNHKNGHHLHAKNHPASASRRTSQHNDSSDEQSGDDGQNFDDATFVMVLPTGNSSDTVIIVVEQGGDDGGGRV